MYLLCHDISFSFHKLSERMKIVDVLGARVFKDGERLITQVHESDICCCTFVLHHIGLVRLDRRGVSADFCSGREG